MSFFHTVEDIAEAVITNFIKAGKEFTAYDVSTEVHEQIRYKNIRDPLHHLISGFGVTSEQGVIKGNNVVIYNKSKIAPSIPSVVPAKKNSGEIYYRLNASGRICIPKHILSSFNRVVFVSPNGNDLFLYRDDHFDIFGNSVCKKIKKDTKGFLNLRKKHLNGNTKFRLVSNINGMIHLTGEK